MMRVLLFVQTGDARPACATAPRLNRIRVNGEWFLTEQEAWRQKCADRWWLVECGDADRGRAVIASQGTATTCDTCGRWNEAHSDFCRNVDRREVPLGRILASGGRP